MNSVAEPMTEGVASVRFVDDPTSLSVLRQPDCAAAIWRRKMPPAIHTWLEQLKPVHLPHGRVTVPVDSVEQAVGHLFDIAEMPEGEARDWLQTDITDLATLFADLMAVGYLRLRLDVVANNACRKFHIDAVTARMVCTYRGSGTQYGVSANGQDPHVVLEAATGAPIFLRGTMWPENPPSGVRHRSPPIEGTGETRLVLVLDPILDIEDEV